MQTNLNTLDAKVTQLQNEVRWDLDKARLLDVVKKFGVALDSGAAGIVFSIVADIWQTWLEEEALKIKQCQSRLAPKMLESSKS